MKSLLRNIVVVLCLVLSVVLGSIRHESDSPQQKAPEASNTTIQTTDYTHPLSELCDTRTSHLDILQRIPTNTRRADTENRHNLTYIKAGKIINTGRYYTTYNLYKLRNSVLSEPSHRLICLGKLII